MIQVMKQISLALAVTMAFAASPLAQSTPALAQSAAPSAQGAGAGDAERGKAIFLKDDCYTCHGTTGAGGVAGPQLAHQGLNVDIIKQQIRNPQTQMPSYSDKILSDAEIADIAAYIQSLSDGPKPTGKDIPLLNQ
jgi:ubiquinol-cytochrome c reductase cytochrome c subunit